MLAIKVSPSIKFLTGSNLKAQFKELKYIWSKLFSFVFDKDGQEKYFVPIPN